MTSGDGRVPTPHFHTQETIYFTGSHLKMDSLKCIKISDGSSEDERITAALQFTLPSVKMRRMLNIDLLGFRQALGVLRI